MYVFVCVCGRKKGIVRPKVAPYFRINIVKNMQNTLQYGYVGVRVKETEQEKKELEIVDE